MADVVAIRIKADAKQAKGELKSLGGSLDSAGKASVAAGVAFAAAGAAIIAMGAAAIANAKGIAKMGDEIAKTARIVGVSGEQFQVLRFAAERSGVAMGSVTSGMKRLARSMFDAQNGSKQIRDTFIGMGIAFEDSNGELRDSYDVLQDVAERMKKVGVTTRTTAEAQVILGRSGADLTNLLIGGKAALVGYEETLRTLGGVMSEETLKASEDYEDSVTDLKAAITGLRIEMGAPLLDVMTEFNEKAASGTSGLKNLAAGFGELSASVLQFSLDVGSQVLDDIFGDDPNKGLGGAADVAARKARRRAQQQRDLARSTSALTGFFGGGAAPSANATTGGGGKKAEAVEEHRAVAIDMVAITQEAQRLQTQAAIEGLADRLYWKRDALAVSKALEDQALEEAKQRADEETALAQRVANDKVNAANAAFSAVEQFAGMAQTAVEDSYFGQTKAGRTAAKALFIAGKAAALASAIVNTAQAISASAAIGYPAAIPGVAAAGITGGAAIGTIVATTIQGLADAGLAPGALRDAGLHGHTAIAISPGEAVIDPVGTAEISRMLALQRRQMEMAAQGGANGGPIVVVAELDGRRVSRGLSGPMTADLEDGHDFRRNARMEVG